MKIVGTGTTNTSGRRVEVSSVDHTSEPDDVDDNSNARAPSSVLGKSHRETSTWGPPVWIGFTHDSTDTALDTAANPFNDTD